MTPARAGHAQSDQRGPSDPRDPRRILLFRLERPAGVAAGRDRTSPRERPEVRRRTNPWGPRHLHSLGLSLGRIAAHLRVADKTAAKGLDSAHR